MLTYYMKYASLQHKKLGKTVVQTAIWRSSDNRVKRLPQTVLFNILLRLFDTVLSDKHHTPDGQNFWKRLMLIAAQRGLTIGLIDGEDITIYQSGDVMRWIDSLDAWSDDDEYEKKRLFITKRRGAEHQ